MQKFICIIITILLAIFIPTEINANTYYINYNNIEMTQQEYNNLMELGFNKNEIYYMNNVEFINNKNINGTLVGKSEQYYKTTTITKNGISISNNKVINEEQYEKQKDKTNTNIHSGYFGIVESEYKKMITNIIKIDEYQYRFKITLFWLKIPKIRSYDIIGIGLQPAYVQINSSIYAQQNYTYKNGNSSSSITCIPIENKNGGSAIFKLPTGNIK